MIRQIASVRDVAEGIKEVADSGEAVGLFAIVVKANGTFSEWWSVNLAAIPVIGMMESAKYDMLLEMQQKETAK